MMEFFFPLHKVCVAFVNKRVRKFSLISQLLSHPKLYRKKQAHSRSNAIFQESFTRSVVWCFKVVRDITRVEWVGLLHIHMLPSLTHFTLQFTTEAPKRTNYASCLISENLFFLLFLLLLLFILILLLMLRKSHRHDFCLMGSGTHHYI